MIGLETRTVVVGRHLIEVELEIDDRPRSVGLLIRVDGAKRWSSEEPGWRHLGSGIDRDFFVWSARRLVVVPLEFDAEVNTIECDDDIITVFRCADLWLLVCESSLQLSGHAAGEVSRIELSDVVDEAQWDQDVLTINCGDGASVRVAVEACELKVLPSV